VSANLPELPYRGPSSGWSGTDTSQARAERRDTNGATRGLQGRLLRVVEGLGPRGITVAEARRLIPHEHHGSISGALSNLHLAGRLACLVDTRDRCHIYVTPDYVRGRETRKQGRR
jgi:hypothetical protein